MLSANSFYAWSRPLITFLVYFPIIGLCWIGGHKVIAGALSVGTFVALLRYCERFFNPIMVLAREIQVIQQAFSGGERVASFLLQSTEDHVLGKNGNLNIIPEGKIELRSSVIDREAIRFFDIGIAPCLLTNMTITAYDCLLKLILSCAMATFYVFR